MCQETDCVLYQKVNETTLQYMAYWKIYKFICCSHTAKRSYVPNGGGTISKSFIEANILQVKDDDNPE